MIQCPGWSDANNTLLIRGRFWMVLVLQRTNLYPKEQLSEMTIIIIRPRKHGHQCEMKQHTHVTVYQLALGLVKWTLHQMPRKQSTLEIVSMGQWGKIQKRFPIVAHCWGLFSNGPANFCCILDSVDYIPTSGWIPHPPRITARPPPNQCSAGCWDCDQSRVTWIGANCLCDLVVLNGFKTSQTIFLWKQTGLNMNAWHHQTK